MKITKTVSGKTEVKLSKQDWINIGKKAGWGSSKGPYDDAPEIKLMDGPDVRWENIPDEIVHLVAKIAYPQGVVVTDAKSAYKYALQDEEALDLVLPYIDE